MLTMTYLPGVPTSQILADARQHALEAIADLEALEFERDAKVCFNRDTLLCLRMECGCVVVSDLAHAMQFHAYPVGTTFGLVDNRGEPFELVWAEEAREVLLDHQHRVLSALEAEIAKG